ncbi:hypothetical protein KKF55_05650 [Patescibacteria group bacterium]|nr:hypothetical protein [Patescibacteria group bacterium]
MPSPVRRHMFALVVTAAVISVLSFQSFRASVQPSAFEPVRVEIGVEHEFPLSIALSVSELKGSGLLDIKQEGEEVVSISLPSSWQRKEVRNVSLSEVTEESASFGFKRYQLPAGASVTFAISQYPDTLLIHNPSGITMKVDLKIVDLQTNTVEANVVLVQDSPAQLW